MTRVLDGLVYDLPEVEYFADSGLSSTGAKKILQSPAHFQDYITHPEEPKSAFDIGSAVHARVLGVGAQVEVYPDEVLAKNGSTNTNAARAFEEETRAAGRIPLKRVEFNVINRMAESVLSDQTARALVENGRPEVSMFTTDPLTSVRLRGRLDYLRQSTIADLKTTGRSASEVGFRRDVFELKYHVQFALYEHIFQTITGQEAPSWLWIVVEKTRPYLTGVHRLGGDEMDIGRAMARRAIDRYAECRDRGIWPGYRHSTQGPIGIIKAPAWVINEYIDEYGDAA